MRRTPLRKWAALVVAPAVLLTVVAAPTTAVAADPTVDRQYSGTGPIAGGTSATLLVIGRGGVPDTGVGSVALNVTVTNATESSFLTVHPAGAQRPNAANLVFHAGQTIPNMVIVPVGAGGQVEIFNFAGTADVVVDVLGWFPESEAFVAMNPTRVLDTRPAYTTIDGKFEARGPIGAGAVLDLKITNRGGALPASGIGAVALSVTVTEPTAGSFLTVWPTGEVRPTAANLNYVAGQSVANMVLAKVGKGGQVSLFNYAGDAHVVVDVLGWVPNKGGAFNGIVPARLLDTRPGYEDLQIGDWVRAVGPKGTLDVDIPGRATIPERGVGSVALNVTVTNASSSSFLTIYPFGEELPTAANLNWSAGETVSNMVIVKVGRGGLVSLYNLAGTADVIVDVLGWFPTTGSFTGLTPARIMDSR